MKRAAAALTALALTVTLIPAAQADTGAVTSMRSFAALAPRADLTAEATSVTGAGDWGGIEDANVPQVQSPAEREAVSRAARREAIAKQQQQAQSFAGVVPASARESEVVAEALKYVGAPYVYGGTTPAGWDCSGFTMYVFGRLGVNLPHASSAQASVGVAVPADQARPGDLMVKPGHVGIYLGNGMMVHASTPRTGTIVASASYATFQYRRII